MHPWVVTKGSTMSAQAPYVLALDEGTTNAKAIAIAATGRILASASAPVPVTYPQPGWVEQDATAIWDAQLTAIRHCLHALPDDAAPPAAITISNQRESVVCWNADDGRPLTPVLGWQDSRTAEFCDWLRSPEREFTVATTTGLTLDPMFSAPKMRYLLDRVTATHTSATPRIGTIDSWLISCLTNHTSYVIEAGNASRTLLFDLATLTWSQNICDLFGIEPTLLPRILPSNADFGTTQGLEILPDDIPIVAVLGDSHAALFGHGCRSPREAKVTYGTGSSVMIPSGTAHTIRPGLSTTLAWLTDQPMYGHEGNIVATGTAMDWTARLLGIDPGPALDDLAATVPDAGGLTLVPAFTGLGAPWWDRSAVGLMGGLTAGTTRAHLARAALDAVAHQIADVLDALPTDSLTTLHADGGATASSLLMQRQADVLGRTVVVSSCAEVSALGAALMGFTHLGWPLPDLGADDGCRYDPMTTPRERDAARAQWADALARSRCTSPRS